MTQDRDEYQDRHEDHQDDRNVEEAGVWIRDTLGRRSGGFYHLGYSSARPAHWQDQEELEDPSHLEEFRLVAEGLGAHGQGEAGLVVMVTDDQGSGRARCFLAFQIARLLGEGGARVLIVDGEFEEDGPGEWLGEPGREGLLDIARYGASPRACLQRLALPNVELMGVGSFRPDVGEALEGEEIESTLRQLRSNWNFVLCTAPSHYADGRFNPLFQHGDGVLMGVTLRGEARDRFEELADYLLDEGVNVFGVMAFSEPGEESGTTAPVSEPEAVEVSVEEEASSRASSPYADLPRATPHQSSRVFRSVAVGIIVALVVFVGLWFGIQWLQRPDPVDLPPLAHERALGEPAQASGQTQELQLAGDGGVGASSGESRSESSGETSGKLPPAGADSAADETQIADASGPESSTLDADGGRDSEAADQVGDSGGTGTRTSPPAEEPETLPEPVKVKPEPVVTPPPTDSRPAELLLRPSSGYALHLWSFPDSMQALPSVRKLEAEGYQPVVRGAEIKGRGIWYRVLIGNYATKRDAMDARELLSDRPDIDYVGVLKVGG